MPPDIKLGLQQQAWTYVTFYDIFTGIDALLGCNNTYIILANIYFL
jgi:hypothetical protein